MQPIFDFVLESIESLQAQGKSNILIFAPHYIKVHFVNNYKEGDSLKNLRLESLEFTGVPILDNYDNSVVVSYRDVHLDADKKGFKLMIP